MSARPTAASGRPKLTLASFSRIEIREVRKATEKPSHFSSFTLASFFTIARHDPPDPSRTERNALPLYTGRAAPAERAARNKVRFQIGEKEYFYFERCAVQRIFGSAGPGRSLLLIGEFIALTVGIISIEHGAVT
ncbi:MAG: hypothetical protein H7Z14_14055 [Anaerolineae bacterium]|nr:hypothetical protein [Phycisphaerae bacterium]